MSAEGRDGLLTLRESVSETRMRLELQIRINTRFRATGGIVPEHLAAHGGPACLAAARPTARQTLTLSELVRLCDALGLQTRLAPPDTSWE